MTPDPRRVIRSIVHWLPRWRTETWDATRDAHRGNQCTMLRMTRRGSGVTVDYTFHPLARTSKSVPSLTGRFELLRTA